MNSKPSKNHKNSKSHNWLMYKIQDQSLIECVPYFKGIMFDFGSGDAPYREFFLKHVTEYVTVDWGSSIHDINPDVIADLNSVIPIDSNIADTIVSISVLEHLCEPEVMLSEAFRILKPNGHIFIQVPWQWWIHEEPYDYFRYSPYGLEYLLKKCGFEIVLLKPQAGFFTMIFIKTNYFLNRFIRGPLALRFLFATLLYPLFYFNQIIAPFLDKLDKNWSYESTGFVVVARKNN